MDWEVKSSGFKMLNKLLAKPSCFFLISEKRECYDHKTLTSNTRIFLNACLPAEINSTIFQLEFFF